MESNRFAWVLAVAGWDELMLDALFTIFSDAGDSHPKIRPAPQHPRRGNLTAIPNPNFHGFPFRILPQ
jgi:hypothetical protein